MLGPYYLAELLGAGGMGAVYRGVHEVLEQSRAIKVMSLPIHLAGRDSFLRLFQREARLAARLRHPNIVQIYDVAQQDGIHYIVMELLEGRSLTSLIRSTGALPLERAIHLLEQLASALDFAHIQGVIHRDLKPANAFVGDDDHLTLVDFGIARASDETHLSITAGIGTFAYMAPEVFDESLLADDQPTPVPGASADLYALGVVAFELVTGQVPFRGTNHQLMHAHLNRTPPSPLSLQPDLPEGVASVILRQLEKNPADRYPSPRDFVAELTRAAHQVTRHGSEGAVAESVPSAEPSPRGTSGAGACAVAGTPSTGTAGPRSRNPHDLAAAKAEHTRATLGGRPAGAEGMVSSIAASTAAATEEERPPSPTVVTTAAPSRARPPAVLLVGIASALALGLILTSVLLLRVLGRGPLTSEASAPQAEAVTVPIAPPAVASNSAQTSEPPTFAATSPTATAIATAPMIVLTATIVQPTATTEFLTPTPSPDDQLKRALATLASGDYARAITELEALRTASPPPQELDTVLYRAHLEYGRALLERSEWDASYSQFGEALKIVPDGVAASDGQREVILRRAWTTMEANWGTNDEAAIAALEEILGIDPGYRETRDRLYDLLIAKADRLLAANDRDGAFSVLLRAVEVSPDRPEARALLQPFTPTATPLLIPPAPRPTAPPVSVPSSQPTPTRVPVDPFRNWPSYVPTTPRPTATPSPVIVPATPAAQG